MAKQKTSGWHFSTSHTSSIQSATSFRMCGLITGPEPIDKGDKVDEDASVAQDKRADGRYLDSFLSNVLRTCEFCYTSLLSNGGVVKVKRSCI